MTDVIQTFVDRDLAEAGRQSFTQDVACDVVATDRGADDAIGELERENAGAIVRGLFDERSSSS